MWLIYGWRNHYTFKAKKFSNVLNQNHSEVKLHLLTLLAQISLVGRQDLLLQTWFTAKSSWQFNVAWKISHRASIQINSERESVCFRLIDFYMFEWSKWFIQIPVSLKWDFALCRCKCGGENWEWEGKGAIQWIVSSSQMLSFALKSLCSWCSALSLWGPRPHNGDEFILRHNSTQE